MRILIADDEAIIRLGLKAELEEMGHQVVATAADGIAAVEQARATRPDLAILDIKMPGLDGLEAAETIAAERPMPIVILSAYADRRLVERAASLAVHGYLVKPVRPSELEPALEIAVSRFEEAETLRREAQDLQEALRTRATVDEAKRMLIKARGWREEEAFRRLQARARSERRTMRQVAEELLQGRLKPEAL
ncbi:MAG: ANTAR domain-containing response regulator [Thiobacillaceae bacterium]